MDISTLAWIALGTWTLLGVVGLYLAAKVASAINALIKQGLTFERVFSLGQASERTARQDAHDLRAVANGHDTGPFRAVR